MLTKKLEDKMNIYGNEDKGWVQFIKDHKRYIQGTAHKYVPPLDKLNTFKYRLEHYLQEMQFPMSAAWIVRYINDYKSNSDFTDLYQIALPDVKVLSDLLNKYKSLKTHYS